VQHTGRSILGTEVLIFKKLLATVDDSTLTFMRLMLGIVFSRTAPRKSWAGSAAMAFRAWDSSPRKCTFPRRLLFSLSARNFSAAQALSLDC